MEFTSLNYVDYLAIVILFISAMLSTIRGMTREFLGLVGWFVAIFIAKLASPVLAPMIENIIPINSLIIPLSLLIPFLGAFIVWFVFASVVSPKLSQAGLGALDGGMGVFFGLARGFVIVSLFYLTLVVLYDGEKNIPASVKRSNTAQFSLFLINSAKPVLPASIQRQFDKLSLPEIQSRNMPEISDKDFSSTSANSSLLDLRASPPDSADTNTNTDTDTDTARSDKNPVAVNLQERDLN